MRWKGRANHTESTFGFLFLSVLSSYVNVNNDSNVPNVICACETHTQRQQERERERECGKDGEQDQWHWWWLQDAWSWMFIFLLRIDSSVAAAERKRCVDIEKFMRIKKTRATDQVLLTHIHTDTHYTSNWHVATDAAHTRPNRRQQRK